MVVLRKKALSYQVSSDSYQCLIINTCIYISQTPKACKCEFGSILNHYCNSFSFHMYHTHLETVRLYLEQQKLHIGGKDAVSKQVKAYQVQFIQIFHDHTTCTKYYCIFITHCIQCFHKMNNILRHVKFVSVECTGNDFISEFI